MIDIEAIKARLSVITPGAWYQGTYPDGDPIDGPTGEHSLGDNILCEGEEIARAECTTDAAFIAHAPTDIAALIAEVEALRSEALTMRQWAEEAAAAENANARELREARAEATCLRDTLNRMRDEMSNIAEDIYRDLWVVQFDDRGRAYEKRITDVLMRFSR